MTEKSSYLPRSRLKQFNSARLAKASHAYRAEICVLVMEAFKADWEADITRSDYVLNFEFLHSLFLLIQSLSAIMTKPDL